MAALATRSRVFLSTGKICRALLPTFCHVWPVGLNKESFAVFAELLFAADKMFKEVNDVFVLHRRVCVS